MMYSSIYKEYKVFLHKNKCFCKKKYKKNTLSLYRYMTYDI